MTAVASAVLFGSESKGTPMNALKAKLSSQEGGQLNK